MLAHRIQLTALTALALLFAAPSAYAQQAQQAPRQSAALEQQATPVLRQEELDQFLAPIALYSDALIAQVLMAATYPLEVVEADRWARAHTSLHGDALLKALEHERWDQSVKALVQVPTVLRKMSENIEWTEKIGNAFLAQQQDVMASVQRLRHLADNSNCRCLENNERQTVVRRHDTIVIEQASPNVIYAPTYNPVLVYGAWPYPAYPPYYWGWGLYGSYGYAGHYGGYGYWPYPDPILWGVGLAITGALWHDHYVDWHGGYIGVGRHWGGGYWGGRGGYYGWRGGAYANRWQHNSLHRRGVDYSGTAMSRRLGGTDRTLTDRGALRTRNAGDAVNRRGVSRLGTRDLSGARNARSTRAGRGDSFGTQRGGRDQFGARRGNRSNAMRANSGNGRDRLGPRGRTRDQFGTRSGGRNQVGARTRGRDQFGGRSYNGGRSRSGMSRAGYSRGAGSRGGAGRSGAGRGGNRGGRR